MLIGRLLPGVFSCRPPVPSMPFPLLATALCLALGQPAASWDGGAVARSARIQREDLDELAAQAQVASPTQTTHVELVPGANCECASRAYAASCPIGWEGSPSGQCQPPADYSGLCSKALSFAGDPDKVKMEAEVVCGFCWPCS